MLTYIKELIQEFRLYNQRRHVQDLIEIARLHAMMGRQVSEELEAQVAKLRGMI